MNEINLSALSGPLGVDKSYSNTKHKQAERNGESRDTIQLSQLPDLSAIEAALEEEFAALRSKVQKQVATPEYPPLETIDRLAGLFAMNLEPVGDPTKQG